MARSEITPLAMILFAAILSTARAGMNWQSFARFGPVGELSFIPLQIDTWWLWAVYMIVAIATYSLVIFVEELYGVRQFMLHLTSRAKGVMLHVILAPQIDLAIIPVVIAEIFIYYLLIYLNVRAIEQRYSRVEFGASESDISN